MRYRVVRTADLDQLRRERDEAHRDRDNARSEAAMAADSAIRAELVAEDLLRQVAQAHADGIVARRERDEQFAGLQSVIRLVTAERDEARRERDEAATAARANYDAVAAQMGADLAQLRADATDPETGASMRAGIAYGVLARMITEARAEGELRPPFDVVALVLGLTDPAPEADQAAEIGASQ
ncbi:hypothetical protein [Streptomyces filamentosus]|uniref:hypothetical protein n=1 Tax=Streptomyces filamentosus TaxID=67294 RepID=UPI00332F3A0E